MKRIAFVAGLSALLAGCAHPEDRRWKSASDLPAALLPAAEVPSVQVYAFSPPKADSTKLSIKDFSDHGQATIIAALALKASDPEALRKALAAPIVATKAVSGTDDRTRLAGTLVISIGKGPGSKPGDRLVRTVVTIMPTGTAQDSPQFEFAGYSVAATDNRVQNIAHLEDDTNLSITGSLAPTVGGFGGAGVAASAATTRKSTTDIAQQYENLNVDIQPGRLVVTRESERGLDVVGNTLISLTLAAAPNTHSLSNFVVSAQKLFDKGSALPADKATFALSAMKMFARHDLTADVTLRYVLRRIVAGREYYAEGKQTVELVDGVVPVPGDDRTSPFPTNAQLLVRAADTQPPLYVVCAREPGRHALMARSIDGQSRIVTYDDLDDARAMATWLAASTRRSIGGDGIALMLADDLPLPAGVVYFPMTYSRGCGPTPAAAR